jgi:hypothetical protein
MSLLASLTADLDRDRRALLRRYGELLAADANTALAAIATTDSPALATTDSDAPDPVSRSTPHASRSSLKDLKQLMQRLSKSEPDVATDLALVRRAGRAQRHAALPSDHLARITAASAAVAAYDAETAKLIQSRRAEYFRLYNIACELQEQRTRASNARQELARLKQSHPDLLSHVEIPERQAK